MCWWQATCEGRGGRRGRICGRGWLCFTLRARVAVLVVQLLNERKRSGIHQCVGSLAPGALPACVAVLVLQLLNKHERSGINVTLGHCCFGQGSRALLANLCGPVYQTPTTHTHQNMRDTKRAQGLQRVIGWRRKQQEKTHRGGSTEGHLTQPPSLPVF